MNAVSLEEVTTKDGLQHQGIFFRPAKPVKRAIVWIHGLTGKFYGDVTVCDLVMDACEAYGWGFASFNNRGHDFISGGHRINQKAESGYTYVNLGAGYEVFEECVFDIHAYADFMAAQGFDEVILIGHSTGALKVGYSEAVSPHPNVAGIVLTGPVSDYLSPSQDSEKVERNLTRMKQLIADGKGDDLQTDIFFFPMTPKRFVSLFDPESAEESVFDYGATVPKMKMLKKITKPLFVIVSEKDENLDRPAEDVIRVFNEHKPSDRYTGLVFPGANHGFDGMEKQVIQTITDWIKTV
jgi:pimeloyl-ACP methyl ester carboxylesterase